MHHPRPFQVIEPSQWFWRGIHIHRWMSSEGYHMQLSWDRSCSWSILMTYWGDSLVYRQIQWVSTPKSARLFGSALNDRFCKQHSCKSCHDISWKWWIVESILFLPSYHLTRSTMNQPRLHQNRNRAFYDETLAIVHHHKRQQRTVQWSDHQSNICFNRPHSRRILKKYNVGLPVSSLTSTWIPPLRMCNGIIGQIRVRFSSA